MMEQAFMDIGARFPLTKRDAGEYAAFKASPMSIRLDWYAAEGLGNVSLLHGRALGGLMNMDTLVINPIERDMPLFSYDYIAAMGKQTMLVEYYDTLLSHEGFEAEALESVKEGIAALPDCDLGEHWYDSMKLGASFAKRTNKRALPRLGEAFRSALDAYLAMAAERPRLGAEAQLTKREKAADYVGGLLRHGGPSTDAFIRAIGAERTNELFTRIVFGTEE